jgi:hypothetical protein
MTDRSLTPDATVRAVLAAWPQTRPVFERHGLMNCGGAAGPDEPLDFFARVHHVPLPGLLAELKAAIGPRGHDGRAEPPREQTGHDGPPQGRAGQDAQPPRVFVPFFIAALLLALTFGATLGMLNLARLTGTGWGTLTRPSVWAHAYVQVFGFVGLFVMGVAYHVIPRFVATPLQGAGAVPWSFRLQLGGVCAIAVAFLLPSALTPALWLAGTLALVGGSVLFATVIFRTLAARRLEPQPFEPWLKAGVLWLVAGSLVTVAAAAQQDVTWHWILWPAALFGFAGSWILGVGRRIFPVFLDWETRWPGAERPVFALYQLGVIGWSAGAWPGEHVAFGASRGVGAVLLLVSVPWFAAILGLFGSRPSGVTGDRDRGYARYIYAAWIWLFVGLLFGPAWTLGALAGGRYGSITVLEFARHAIALGFVTQMIMGVASRVVPVFTGHPLWSPRARDLAFWLLNLAVALRGLQAVVAMGVWPALWPYVALSGPPAVAALLLFGANMIMTVRAGRAAAAGAGAGVADRTVAELLRIPGALAVLVGAGFTPLANATLRAAFAGTVTLRQACRLKDVPLEPLVAQIEALAREAAPTGPASPDGRAPVVLIRRSR